MCVCVCVGGGRGESGVQWDGRWCHVSKTQSLTLALYVPAGAPSLPPAELHILLSETFAVGKSRREKADPLPPFSGE